MSYSILIVDASATVRALVKRSRRQTEFGSARVFEADGGEEVLDLLEHGRVDVVLIDPRLPGTNGYELIGRIRAEPDIRGTPVVVMSPDLPDGPRPGVLRRLGVRAEIRKPVDPAALRDVLRRILEPTHV